MATIAVVGASLAGLRVVQELRRLGSDDRIVLIGSEHHLPYDRPPLSKGLLVGTVEAESLTLADAKTLAGLDVTLRLGEAIEEVDVDARRLRTPSGSTLGYDTLVIATGTRARNLEDFNSLANVHYLRTVDDGVALRESMDTINRLAIVGGGLIGGEVAATARKFGLDVTVIDVVDRPFHRTLGELAGSIIEQHHRDMGVVFRYGSPIAGIVAASSAVESIRLADGRVVEADTVLISVGVVPNTDWLRGTRLDLTDGVLCDAMGRCAENVWAVGDVARWPDPRTGIARRFEHWSNAVDQARAVAWNIAAPDESAYRVSSGIPYFWTDQYEHKVQVFGTPERDDEFVVLSHDPDALKLSGVFCRDGRARAAVAVNARPEIPVIRRHVADRTPATDLITGSAI